MNKSQQKMLITGASGMLGNNLAIYFRHTFDVLGLYHEHPFHLENVRSACCDVRDHKNTLRIIKAHSPKYIIHCASLTNIEFCEENKSFTDLVNVEGTRVIHEAAQSVGAKFVYISSDSVYEGTKGNYSEEDDVKPQNYYGESKLKAEQCLLDHNESLILRTNLFGWNIQAKNSLAEWILRNISRGKSISGFTDVYFSSIYTMDLARLIEQGLKRHLKGVYVCASRTGMSKYEFAKNLAQLFGYDTRRIQPISIDEFPFRAKRGKNLSLDVSKFSRDAGVVMPNIEECLSHFYGDFQGRLFHDAYQRSVLSDINAQ